MPRGSTVEELVRSRLSQQLGGPRGSLEAAAPTVVFVIAWTVGHDFRLAVAGHRSPSVVVLLALRLVQRQTPRFVLSSIWSPSRIAAYFVHRSGRAQDAFLPGILYSAGAGALTLLSVLLRWPLLGFVVGAAEDPEDPLAWHRDRGIVRLCQRLTWSWSASTSSAWRSCCRSTGPTRSPALGVAKIVLSWPLYLLGGRA